jgi:hypothetical protein
MEKSLNEIYRVFLILGFSWVSASGIAQDPGMTRQIQKETKEAEKIRRFEDLDTLLESRRFVFIAHTKQNGEGLIETTDPDKNYIRFEFPRVSAKLERIGSGGSLSVTSYFNTQVLRGIIDHWELLKNTRKLNYCLIVRSVPENASQGNPPNFTMWIFNDRTAMVRLAGQRKTNFSTFSGRIKEL